MRSAGLAFAAAVVALVALAAPEAYADETTTPSPPPATQEAPIAAPAQIDLEKDKQAIDPNAPAEPLEAPPPPPYKKSVVIDTTLGAMRFLGKFGDTAPAAPWLHSQLGYEVLSWLMFFGEGELAFTDTSGTEQPPKTRTLPIFGFGGGARFTVRFTDRLGVYLQGSFGAMKAQVTKNGLAIIGYPDAESLGLYAAGRLGVEWYMIDRHFALGLTSAIREAQGFKRTGGPGGSDTPLVLDAGASIRYAF